MKKWLKRVLIVLLVLLILAVMVIVFSPYGRHPGLSYKAVSQSVLIDAPVDSVFAYMGNSANAADWSAYVDHITPLNPDQFPDGTVGSQRRCFTRADETGSTWDETILIAEPAQRRRLNIYNLVDFPIRSSHLLTEQLYEKTGVYQCRLTLTFFLDEQADWTDQLKMYIAAYRVNAIFRENLENIKRIIEERYL